MVYKYNEGYAAYHAGLERSACPYPFDTEDCNTWLIGWLVGRYE